jgi:putative DNA primase/helicase
VYTTKSPEETGKVLEPIFGNIPAEFTARPQWIVWRLEAGRDGKLTKVPYSVAGYQASTTDLLSWSTFEAAVGAYEDGGYDGLGFVFSSGDPYVGIDLDDCRDPESGEVAPWARKVIERVKHGHVELSPSGSGVHVILRGRVRGRGRKKDPVEIYSQERFFCVTGRTLD